MSFGTSTNDRREALHSGTAALADADLDGEITLVNGVAIGENDITTGHSGKRTIWPADTLREAAEQLVGKPIVRDHPDIESPQPPIDAVIGEVTDARYEDGVGLLWQGELDDPDIARQVERGRADVSPVMARDLGEYDEERDAHVATEIHAFRDLGVVSVGASKTASIEAGEAAAMGTAALAEAFGDVGTEALSEDEQERLEQIEAEIEAWSGHDTMESYVEGLREELAALGDESEESKGATDPPATDVDTAEIEACKRRVEFWERKNEAVADAEREALAELLGLDDASDVDLEAI